MGLSPSKAVIDKLSVASARAIHEGREDIQSLLFDDDVSYCFLSRELMLITDSSLIIYMDSGSKYLLRCKVELRPPNREKLYLPIKPLKGSVQQPLCLLPTKIEETAQHVAKQ